MKKHRSSYSTIRILLLTLIMTITSIIAPFVHTAYLFDKVGSNTVFIRSPEGAEHAGSATGFEIKAPSGKIYTLTNAHVCGLQKNGVVMVEEKRHSHRLIPRRVLEVYTENDLCLVEGFENYEGLSIADDVDIGDISYAIGYPLGEEMDLSTGFTKGLIEVEIAVPEIPLNQCEGPHLKRDKFEGYLGSFETCAILRKAMQTNIPIYPGNSGSPMFNIYGHVTGVIFASNQQTHWGSAVPLSFINEFLKAY